LDIPCPLAKESSGEELDGGIFLISGEEGKARPEDARE